MRFGWLGVVVMVVGGARPASADGPKKLFTVSDSLTAAEPLDNVMKYSHAKVHLCPLDAGKYYRIDLESKSFNAYLRVESAEGENLAANDNGGHIFDSRIAFRPERSGDYRLIATSYAPRATGAYTLSVVPASARDILEFKAKNLPDLAPKERRPIVEELRKAMAEKGKILDAHDVLLAFQVAQNLERVRFPNTTDIFEDLAKSFSLAADSQAAEFSKTLQGAIRRLSLPGKQMHLEGAKLDGKPLDWASYRGKVVLVHFFASHFDPARVELPDIRKMYVAYKDRGFDIVGVSGDLNAKALAKFMEKEKLPWVCIYEPGKNTQPMLCHYGIFTLPLTMLVGQDGKVISNNVRGAELQRHLEKLLGPLEQN
ncbi:MAG: TlpA family protein disulfide reductase [Gemmataceae bacterium]|nr:TlpA family protein disulfide reductase [Gemmataceae bacterium]MCI0739758.1 TlpA family protein disulfide reductase [Gemmataceae bacterium]